MDLSSFHSSWLALGAQSKGCVPSCFPHLCHVLAFSVSPTGAGLCSGQPAAFEFITVRLVRKLLQTNDASGSRLTSLTMRNGFGVFRIVRKHMNSGPLHLLLRGPLQCQFWDGEVCCTNCLTALNELSIFQDFNRSNDWVTFQQPWQIWQRLWFPQRLLIFNWWQLAQRRLAVDGTPSRQRLSKMLLQTGIALILMGCDTSMVDNWNVLKVFHFHVCSGSSTNWPRVNCWSRKCHAICDNSLGHHQNCLHNVRKLPYDHLVLAILTCNYIQLYTRRSTGCFTFCFLLGAMRWLSCKSAAKSISRFDLDQWSISSLAK